MKEKTLYDILGLSEGAGDIAIKRAYRRLSFVHHPDTGDGDVDALALIKSAYERLSDPVAKNRYDAILSILRSQEKQTVIVEENWNTPVGGPKSYIFSHYTSGSSYMMNGMNSFSSSSGSYGNFGPATSSVIVLRIDDVMAKGLNGLMVGQTVYIGQKYIPFSSPSISPNFTFVMSLKGSIDTPDKGILTSVRYGIAPGIPAYGDFEIELT